ncbi:MULTISPECIES: hypothetical protein [Pseudomonas]|uniref:hypothetical protein n=1 Tax=Pseudomonas TaxID=286 RepID=UPI001B7CD14C|nr:MULTISPECIES: hypothetical protein [unclassified Pseudomonas]MBP1127849.1 hypothetical protein [Pseudomonas sp. PvP025]MDQ0396787.1 hypothetical protein [Pseudomonas sp. PvP006]
MNQISANSPYRSPTPQPQNNSEVNKQQHPSRAFTAPYTANVFGGEAKFQPIPTVTFVPATSATIAARITPLPGGPSVGASATAKFLPEIVLRPNDAGGLNVSVTPKMQLELNADLTAGIPNILGTGIGVRGGGSASKWFTFNAPQASFNLNPDLSFNVSANLNPALTTTQRIGLNGGVQGRVSASGFGAGAGVDQAFTHQTQQEFKLGGPGVKFEMTPAGRPTITQNFDKTVSISNSYSFLPRTSVNANAQAGPITVNAGARVSPGVTVKYKVTFSTDLASKTPPKTEVSVSPGVRVDGDLSVGVSLLPRDWPVSLSASVAAQPYVRFSADASYTV